MSKANFFFCKNIAGIFVGLVYIFVSTPSFGITTTSVNSADCTNEQYRRAHPAKCKFFVGTSTLALGGAALATGAGLAIAGLSGGGGGNSGGNSAPAPTQPTLTTPNQVGGDIDSVTLAGITSQKNYEQNINQYNDIRLAYSLGRGFTGAGSNIAVVDGDTWHGAVVTEIASGTIAPNADVQHYKITDNRGKFYSYGKIGDVIASAQNANIYNFSWSAEMSATDLKSRTQLIKMTDANFVNQISNAAARDAIFVWAAGNDYSTQSSALSALPRVMPELRGHFINVVAYDSETGALAEYSNQCGITMEYCITAPGSDIDAANRTVSGTSFAAPIVSAAVAVLREAFPYMSAPQITQLLFATARDLGTPGVDPVYGHGMLDLERATRPVGAPLVPVADNMMAPLRTAHVPGTIARQVKSANLKFAFFDSFGRPFEAKIGDNISVRNPGRAWTHLHGDDAQSVLIGNMEFGLRKNSVLPDDGFMSAGKNNMMTFVGANNTFEIGDITIFHNAQFGITAPHPSDDSMVAEFSKIYTVRTSLGMQAGDWRAAITIPDAIISGNMYLRTPTGRASGGDILYTTHKIDMTSAPAMEYAISYKYLTAAFVDNPYGTDEFFIMAKTKLQF